MPEEIITVARSVEDAAYMNAGARINDPYKQKMRSLFQNLKNKSNPALRKNVLSGDIAPKTFVTMTHDQMKSDSRRAEDKILEKQNMNQAMVAQVVASDHRGDCSTPDLGEVGLRPPPCPRPCSAVHEQPEPEWPELEVQGKTLLARSYPGRPRRFARPENRPDDHGISADLLLWTGRSA